MRFLFTALFSLSTVILAAQNNWELRKDEDNIKVYTKEVKGYSIKASKVTSVLETTLSQLVAVLMDAENFYKVIPTSKSSKLLKKTSDNKRIYYVSTKAPWPVTDRDGVYAMNFSQDSKTKVVTVVVENLADYYPEQEG